MKKPYLLLLIVCLFIQSCETSDVELSQTLENEIIDMSKIETLREMSNENQRNTFNLLNSKEKHYFRMAILEEFIAVNDLNQIQMDLINDLKVNFTPNAYEKNDSSEYFNTIYINEWSNKAKNHFTIE